MLMPSPQDTMAKITPYILKSFREQYPNIEFELLPSNYNTEIACGSAALPPALPPAH